MSNYSISAKTKSDLHDSLGTQQLALSPPKQSAILGHVFNPVSRIFPYLINVAEVSWWADPLHGLIWNVIKEHHRRYGVCPSMEQVAEDPTLLRRETAEVNRIRSLLELAKINREKFTAAPLRDEVEVWMHAKIMHRAYDKGHHLWNGGKFQESRDMLASTVQQLNATKFMETFERKVFDPTEMAKDLGPSNVVPFGISGVDNHLFPGNPRGSLRKGDQTVIMSAVNVGKSTTLITVIVHNVRSGKHVLYVTHEGHRSDLRLKFMRSYLTLIDEVELKKIFPDWSSEQVERGKRFFRMLAAKPIIDIVNFLLLDPSKPKNPAEPWRARIDTIFNYVQQFITFMPIHKPGMEVEEIAPIIERQQELWRDNHKDADGNPKGYDLFVCDYPGVLTSRQNSKGQLQWRHTQQIVYDTFVQLALKNEWHSLVAIQTNRDGSRINSHTSKSGERRFLTNEDVAECWGAIMSATTVITVNRSPEAMAADRVTFLIAKSRSSRTGYAVTCYSNFGQSVSHAEELGGICYAANNESKAVIDAFMKPGVMRQVSTSEFAGTAHHAGEEVMVTG